MTNRELAHQWAHSDIEDEVGKKGSNFFYQSGVLYSYGLHFIVGTKLLLPNGKKLYMLTNKTYSNTTTQHRSYAWQAIPNGVLTLHVTEPITQNEINTGGTFKHGKNIEALRVEIENAIFDHRKPRSRSDQYGKAARETWDHLENYVDAFNISREDMLKMLNKTEQQYVKWGEDISEVYSEAIDRGSEYSTRQTRSLEERTESALRAWLVGNKTDMGKYASHLDHDHIRMTNGIVETTRGIRIKGSIARNVYKRLEGILPDYEGELLECDLASANDALLGMSILDWNVKEVTKSGMIIVGCHKLNWGNIKQAVKAFGW